ncbi:MAG: ABC-F family ATP-binding cassette domain-containing protein [Planctomycetes bacterium]|nr:ABC-F family ATP-binding cassette domain-containing protein [Planctomycetota bacterium]
MLTLHGISKSYGDRVLFADAALQVNTGDRIGLVGPNGAGKSTLFGLILGEEPPDDGRVVRDRGASIGYLPQESAPVGDETAAEIACAIHPDFVRLLRAVKAWDAGHPEAASHPEDLHDDLHERFHELGGYQVEAKAKQILAGLGFRPQHFDRPARELSGGWVMRAHLARLLVQEPDLLMLDEPTNHLDLESLLWFQQYLQGYPGAILVISHDREFLNELVTGIVEIRNRQLVRYTGNFDRYLAQRDAADAQQLAQFRTQQKEIAHLQAFVDRFKAKASKASQAQSKLKQIERMERVEAPVGDERKVGFRFPQPPRSGQRVVWLQNLHFAYGTTPVYRGVDLEVERGERIVLVGPNGAGKSTLLKLLADKLQPQRGERGLGHNVTVGYYSQYRVDMLRPARTVLQEALDTEAKVTEQAVRTLLGSFLFSGESVFKKVEVLSGGEKSRLALVKLLLSPPNLLLMDEPTTHLDMGSIDALVLALKQFEGTLVFISHDVHFIRTLANKVLHVANGTLTPYLGDYEFYLQKTKALSARAALTAGSAPEGKAVKAAAKGPAPAGGKAKGSGSGTASSKPADARSLDRDRQRQQKRLQQQVEKLEAQVDAAEQQRRTLAQQLEQPEVWSDGPRAEALQREFAAAEAAVQRVTQQWEAAALELESLGRG